MAGVNKCSEVEEDIYDGMGIIDKLISMQGAIFDETDEDSLKELIFNHMTKVSELSDSLEVEDFGQDLEWLNAKQSLSLRNDLAGRIIVVDFFTYCCINCIHIIPHLKKLEEKFPVSSGIVVIGVHSAKFPNERILKSLQEAVLRNKIKHPVVNDCQNRIWNSLSVSCWPTILILGPKGHALFAMIGEGHINKLLLLCEQVLQYFQVHDIKLKSTSLPLNLLEVSVPHHALLYPGKICTDDKGEIIIVSNTGKNQIIIVGRDGAIKDVIGREIPGFKDGLYSEALFNSPQGITWKDPGFIYVADTGNHAIRLIDVHQKTVRTILGIPEESCDMKPNKTESILKETQHLISPWDLCIGPAYGSFANKSDALYIAAAGSHQIWMLYLEGFEDQEGRFHDKGSCLIFAGNGKEENRNNRYPKHAGFAQPSGITVVKESPSCLYVADSESSTIRSISLIEGHVKSVVGGNINPVALFEFGDEDGIGIKARLQHPLGISAHCSTVVYVADSYNHKIKIVNPETRECKTYCGSGISGNHIGEDLLKVRFNEPGGLCVTDSGRYILVADTNNHCIKTIDVEKEVVNELPIFFPSDENDLKIDCGDFSRSNLLFGKVHIQKDSTPVQFANGGELKCKFDFQLDEDVALTDETLQSWKVSVAGIENIFVDGQSCDVNNPKFEPYVILKHKKEGENAAGLMIVSISLNLCKKSNKTCFPRTIQFRIPVEISSEGLQYAETLLSCRINT